MKRVLLLPALVAGLTLAACGGGGGADVKEASIKRVTTTSTSTTTSTTISTTTTTTTTTPPPPPTPAQTEPPVTEPPATEPPATEPPATDPPGGGCDPNYTPCVPIASDVDCAGGGGNGPAYVQGPVQVIGTDIYGLDTDHNGIGCE